MELDERDFLEELLALRGTSTEFFCNNGWSLDFFNENPGVVLPNSVFEGFEPAGYSCSFNEAFGNHDFSIPEINSYCKNVELASPFPFQEEIQLMVEDEEQPNTLVVLNNDHLHSLEQEDDSGYNKVLEEPVQANTTEITERKIRVKKVNGQPSKNLMAERRRRKRLNDRLSMLRSVVPKISKMDRTSILGDTIDYIKELQDRIKNLKEGTGDDEVGSDQLNILSILKDLKPNEILVRNTPKFDVERRDMDTRIEICCTGKPGLLLSTINTLEALGIEIQQCVISCFNDFAVQASCSEELEQRTVVSSEQIKQALFRNAGYGGKYE